MPSPGSGPAGREGTWPVPRERAERPGQVELSPAPQVWPAGRDREAAGGGRLALGGLTLLPVGLSWGLEVAAKSCVG